MLAAILFDLDGTLTNSDTLHFPIWQEFLRDYGLEIDQAFYRNRISGRLNPVLIRDLLPTLSAEAGQALADRKEARFRKLSSQLQRLSGLTDILNWINTRGLKTAVVTNAPRDNAHLMLRSLHLEAAFDTVVISEDVGIGKPDPAPYQQALRNLDVAPESALAFEDSPSGVQAAVAAGISTVGIASTQDPQVLYEPGAMLVVPDFTDPQLWDLLGAPKTTDV